GANSASQSSNLPSSRSHASCCRKRSQRARSSASAARCVARWRDTRTGRRLGIAGFVLGLARFAMARVSALRGGAHRCRMPLRHEVEPGVEHVAAIGLPGRILAAAAAVRIGYVALVAATDLQPFGSFARHSHVESVVDFEIVCEDERARAVDDVGEADGVAKYLLRRAFESER